MLICLKDSPKVMKQQKLVVGTDKTGIKTDEPEKMKK